MEPDFSKISGEPSEGTDRAQHMADAFGSHLFLLRNMVLSQIKAESQKSGQTQLLPAATDAIDRYINEFLRILSPVYEIGNNKVLRYSLVMQVFRTDELFEDCHDLGEEDEEESGDYQDPSPLEVHEINHMGLRGFGDGRFRNRYAKDIDDL